MQGLTPEQNRAVEFFELSEPYSFVPSPVGSLTLSQISITGSCVLVEGKVVRKNLPREPHWNWHQSLCKETISTGLGTIGLAKFSPRKRDSVKKKTPFLKLWWFSLSDSAARPLHFLWCEKGKHTRNSPPSFIREITKKATRQKATKQQKCSLDDLKVSDLSFLKEFLDDPSLALQFGWEEKNPKTNKPKPTLGHQTSLYSQSTPIPSIPCYPHRFRCADFHIERSWPNPH